MVCCRERAVAMSKGWKSKLLPPVMTCHSRAEALAGVGLRDFLFDSHHTSISWCWLDFSCQPAWPLLAWCRQGLETLIAASSVGLRVSCSTLGLGACHGMVALWGSWCPVGWQHPGTWGIPWDSGTLGLGVPCRRMGTAFSSLQAANSLAQVIKS